MTIKGFIDFIRSNKDVNQSIELNKTIVIFDGHQIQSKLDYFSSQTQKEKKKFCDYTSYAETIKSFFRRLKVCEVVPIIYFDGSINPIRYRNGVKDRIKEIHEIEKMGYSKASKSPTLRQYVFSSIARSFGVEIIQTCSNTWTQVSALANKLMCPVYSSRNDFYFLDLENGLLDDDSILRSRLHYNTEKKHWFLSSTIIRMDFLVKKFNGLKLEVMPLLGVLFEDDFINQNGYKGLSDEIQELHKSDKIEVILNWIKGKSLDICLESITQYLKPFNLEDQKKDESVRNLIKKFKSNGNDSVIRKYLNESDLDNESLKMLAKGDTEVLLPKWFVDEYQKGIIRPALMNVVKMKTHIVFPQIEDFSQTSSYECTHRLRRFLYGILRTEIDNSPPIKVLDRTTLTASHSVSLKEELVTPLRYITKSQELPYLGTVRLLEMNERRKLFLSIMKVSEAFINRCKVSLLLLDFFEEISTIESTNYLIVITRYLIQNKPNKDWKPSIGALILSIMFYGNPQLRTDLKWTNMTRIVPEEHFKPQFIQFFAELQACLHISNFINTILEMPFEEGKPYFCLNGIFFYNAIKNLWSVEEYESFLRYLFRNQPVMEAIFSDIHQLIGLDLNV